MATPHPTHFLSSLSLSIETMSMSRQLYPLSATHTNLLCLPPKGWWQQSNFLLMWMLYLPSTPTLPLTPSVSISLSFPSLSLSHGSPALQTSDLISDISAVIDTGTLCIRPPALPALVISVGRWQKCDRHSSSSS